MEVSNTLAYCDTAAITAVKIINSTGPWDLYFLQPQLLPYHIKQQCLPLSASYILLPVL
jgi:hypothetical protein